MRPLSRDELSLVSGGDGIVVTAHLQNTLSIWGFTVKNAWGYDSVVENTRPATGDDVATHSATDVANPQDVSASVNVLVADASHQAAALDAGANVARALARIESALAGVPTSTQIVFDGRSLTVGTVLDTLHNTKFIIDDAATYNNGGVGSAQIGTSGNPNVDHLNYAAFTGTGSYADSNYQKDAGLVGILLHEIGHLTTVGDAFRTDEINWYKKDYGTTAGFEVFTNGAKSAYSISNEKFANDFSLAVVTATGTALSLTGYSPTFGYGAEPGASIYADHHHF